MDNLQYQKKWEEERAKIQSFKPYYKWITFNTAFKFLADSLLGEVLNLIING